MPEKTKNENSKVTEINIKADLLAEANEETKRPAAAAYAFTVNGQLLSSAKLDESGATVLRVPATEEAQDVRVLIGPEIENDEGENKTVAVASLKRRGAEEQRLQITPENRRAAIEFTVRPEVWRCWFGSLCFVRGTVLKPMPAVNLPVFKATVEVYEVDPLYIIIPRLPDYVIEKIRDHIINPPPPPGDPFGRKFPSRLSERANTVEPKLNLTQIGNARSSLTTAKFAAPTHAVTADTELRFLAGSTGTFQFRQALLANPLITRNILCLIYPQRVTMQLVTTATTDRCGHFQTFFFRGCHNPDAPDLYFKVKQHIIPFLPPITIYAPTPVACHTHWNYVCGTEVTIYPTHPLTIGCAPCPDDNIPNKGVVVKAVGNILLNQIYGTSTTSPAPVTNTNRGLTHDNRPWGGLLRLRLDFDPALRADNIKYYQVGYRRGTTGNFQPLNDEIHRYYTTFDTTPIKETVYSLGPKTVPPVTGTPNLFEIPPQLPPGTVGNSEWTIRDIYEETIHAKFPTQTIAPGAPLDQADNAGKYQLEVKLFDGNGQPVNLATSSVTFYVPTDDAPTPAAPLGLVSGNSFIMTLHVDNNVCSAVVHPPTLNGTPATECGILGYSGTSANPAGSVTMQYEATHRNGFANYWFGVKRGANYVTLPPPPATPTLPAAGQVPSGGAGNFSNTQTVADLLDGCPAGGFAADLYVDSLATDGITTELGYDDSDLFAFAIAPASVLSGDS